MQPVIWGALVQSLRPNRSAELTAKPAGGWLPLWAIWYPMC